MANHSAKGVPAGFHTVTPYLILMDADRAIAFYQQAFEAQVQLRHPYPNGMIRHAEIQIGDSMIMIAEAHPERSSSSSAPPARSYDLFLYVPDAHAWVNRAIQAGATQVQPVAMRDEGDERGGVRDMFGVTWWIATQAVVKSRADMQQELDANTGQPNGKA